MPVNLHILDIFRPDPAELVAAIVGRNDMNLAGAAKLAAS